jgi:hypothetical protein
LASSPLQCCFGRAILSHVSDPVTRPLVFSQRNRNYKIEFDFGDVKDYPSAGPPLLLILEVDVRTYRYQLVLPGDKGYEEMFVLNASLPSVGRGLRRVITNLDEAELRWPGCRLRPVLSVMEAAKVLRTYQDEEWNARKKDLDEAAGSMDDSD